MADPREDRLLWIVGASIRAAACSARRAGFAPAGIDLFADWDTVRCCAVERIATADYPHGLARRLPSRNTPCMYTGALENHPEVIEKLAAQGTLWGNGPAVVRRVRDPFLVAEVLAEEGIPHPQVCLPAAGIAVQGDWLLKPLCGAGGVGIRRMGAARHSGYGAKHYLQQMIEGMPCAAIYAAAGGGATFVGVTRQLVGEAFVHAKEFSYCGSVGPMQLGEQTRERFVRLGGVFAARFRLAGIFGVDCVLSGGVPFPVEINPRWTASVEVLEYALGVSGVTLHAEACGGRLPRSPGGRAVGLRSSVARRDGGLACVAKAILYADKEYVAPEPEVFSLLVDTELGEVPAVADVPHGGEQIRRGRPMISVLVAGATQEECLERLREASRLEYRRFLPA
jgi:predicted ATP-grasp superfamily ATP-dependent carboligase